MGRRDVDRAAPSVFDRDVGKAGEHQTESLGRLAHGASVAGEHLVDSPPGATAAAAERAPSIPRGPEVTERGAKVADQLAPGPSDLSQSVGRRGGEHDVAAPGDEFPA